MHTTLIQWENVNLAHLLVPLALAPLNVRLVMIPSVGFAIPMVLQRTVKLAPPDPLKDNTEAVKSALIIVKTVMSKENAQIAKQDTIEKMESVKSMMKTVLILDVVQMDALTVMQDISPLKEDVEHVWIIVNYVPKLMLVLNVTLIII